MLTMDMATRNAPAVPAEGERTGEFEAVALPHLNDLYCAATRLLGDRTAAEDVVQDVYLQAWKYFHRFEAGTDCRAWLFKIMFNTIHHHRSKWLNVTLVRDDDSPLEQMLTYTPPVSGEISDEDILAALDRVPSDYRAVVLLADVEEFSYKQIAQILKIPMGTVMSRLSRGRALLRNSLGDLTKSYRIGASNPPARAAIAPELEAARI